MLRPQRTPDAVPSRFGVFYPRGYLAVAFRHKTDAGRVREQLVAAGYDGTDAQIVPAAAVEAGAGRSLRQVSPLVRLWAGSTKPWRRTWSWPARATPSC